MTSGGNSIQPGVYAVGYGGGAIEWLERRNAAWHAAFFLPHLQPGMSLLDCGCGSGSITVGLAEAVSPGRTCCPSRKTACYYQRLFPGRQQLRVTI
jgi:hypothetical protein